MRLFRLKNLVFSADMQPAFPSLPQCGTARHRVRRYKSIKLARRRGSHAMFGIFSPLYPYIAVQILHLLGLDGLIAPALPELAGVRVMEVLPALRSLFVTEGHESFFGDAADSLIHLFDLTFFL